MARTPRIYATKQNGRTVYAFGSRLPETEPLSVHGTIAAAKRAAEAKLGRFAQRSYTRCKPWKPSLARQVLFNLARRNDRYRKDIAAAYRKAANRPAIYDSIDRFYDVVAFYYQGDDRDYACLHMGGEIVFPPPVRTCWTRPKGVLSVPLTDKVRARLLAALRGPLGE